MTRATLIVLAAASAALAQSGVDYEIILDRPQTQTLRVRATLHDVDAEAVSLSMPVWRPGKYVVLDRAGEVRWYKAEDARGDSLPIEKTDKSTWRIETNGASTVTMEYEVYANDLHNRTMHVDDTHAFLDGSAMLVYAPDRRDQACRVRITAPDDWGIATGLDAEPNDPTLFVAPDFDVLIDCPFEIGVHDLIRFEVEQTPHEIVIWGDTEYDADEMIEDFSAIVKVQSAMYGGLPYDRYVFMVHARDGAGGATEHLNSTILQTSSTTLSDDSRYTRWLGTVSHELFHTWNVKHSRPAGLSPYDYQKENYTTLLWVAEGTTSYYDDLMLVRAGITEPDDYIRSMGNALERLARHPGRRVQSLAESSFDSWIKFGVPGPDRVNTTVNFYSKGALVSWMLDMTIRQGSGGESSLDDVMRDLFEASGWGGPGFTPEDLQAFAESRTGRDLDDFFDSYVRGTEELEIADILGGVGLSLGENDEAADDEDDTGDAYLGLDLRSSGDHAAVRAVREDGPSFNAGIQVDDVIIALDDQRVTGSNLNDLLEDVEPGATVELTYMRNDRLRTIDVAPTRRDTMEFNLKRVDDPTPAQRAAYESWLGQPWPIDAETAVEMALDDWHDAAADADLDRYVAYLADDTVFMGTDATERWDRESFLAFATPYFEDGKAWTFHPRDRVITLAKGEKMAWFDELLDSETYGELRGSGVLVRDSDDWKVAQYNLSIPLPNAIAKDVVEQISTHKREPQGP